MENNRNSANANNANWTWMQTVESKQTFSLVNLLGLNLDHEVTVNNEHDYYTKNFIAKSLKYPSWEDLKETINN